jgi:parvulin-like peptidyl-prolyl isomerase
LAHDEETLRRDKAQVIVIRSCCLTPATLLLTGWTLGVLSTSGCTHVAAGLPVVARSSLGVVTSEDLDRFIASDPRWQEDGAARSDIEWRRSRLEELLALQALAAEARGDRLLSTGAAGAAWQRQRRRILTEEVQARTLQLAPQVTDAEVEAHLAEHPDEASRGERLRLRHIFRHLPASASPDERERALLEMEDLLGQLQDGANFGTLAREHSDSQTAGFDGLIAPVSRGTLDPEVEDVVWGLEVGELSDVVSTAHGLHIFRLEERLPPAEFPQDEIARRIRNRLERLAREEALDAAFDELVQSAVALYRPEKLGIEVAAVNAIVFQLDREVLTAADIRARWQALDFVSRRTTVLTDVLRDAAWELLAQWETARSNLESDPEVAERLERAEWWALASAATERRITRHSTEISDGALAEFAARHEDRYRRPAELRLRAVIVRFGANDDPLSVYDRLDALARTIRSGTRDLEEAARSESSDPSRNDGGDLGWVDAKALFTWAGGRFVTVVLGLENDELSNPLLIEVYDPERLIYRADGYALVRVEDRRPERMPAVEEIREELTAHYLETEAPDIRREMRRTLLQEIGATIDEAALTGSGRVP